MCGVCCSYLPDGENKVRIALSAVKTVDNAISYVRSLFMEDIIEEIMELKR